MRPFLVTLTLGVLLLPGAQHGVADLIDARHGLHGHCHLVFEDAHAHDAHAHDAHAHAHDAHAHDTHARGAHAHDAHAHDDEAGHHVQANAPASAHAHLVLPRPCSAPSSDVPCPHAPLEGHGHHSHATPPMLCASAPGPLARWSAGRRLTFGARIPRLHARATERALDRPPRA